jgi:hypothetical protein
MCAVDALAGRFSVRVLGDTSRSAAARGLRSKGITPVGEPEFGSTGNRELVLGDPDGYTPRFLEKK